MKKLITTCIAVSAFFSGMAQVTSGTVNYSQTIKIDIELEGDMAQFASMIPKEHTSSKILQFSPEASIYKSAPKKETPPSGQNGLHIMMDNNMPDEIIYRDIKQNKMVTQKDFMTRKFLVSGDMEKINWKMTGQQKTILGYPAQQATAEIDSDKVIAWFTPAIPVATGPNEYNGLPGLILEVEQGTSFFLKATSIEPGIFDKSALVKPTGGKKVTTKEFEAIVTEKTKEMQESMGAQGQNIKIKIQH